MSRAKRMSRAKPPTKRGTRSKAPRKSAAKSKCARGAGARKGNAKAKSRAASRPGAKAKSRAPSRKRGAKVVLLSGGNPQIAKGAGDAPVQTYIAAMPGWKRDVGQRLDALIVRSVPSVRKAVKWNSPFYGVANRGWFLSFHVFTRYVKVTFFSGASLQPLPPGA